MALRDLLETAGSIFIQREQIKAGLGDTGVGNTGSEHPRVTTGVDSDGSTLISRQLVAGVSNGQVLAGVGLLVAIGALAIAWAVND